jgi:succinate-semialdehyde dehydrogenase / glutarate-semialdehyde dehydrogenase
MYEAPGLLIANTRCEGRGEPNIPVINPGTEEVLGTIALANGDDVADALASAGDGFAAWRKVHGWARSDALRRIAALLRERLPDIARLLTLEVGKPLREAELEVLSGVEHFEWAADAARQLHGFLVKSRVEGSRGQVNYEPVGIVLALSAWNFPINLAARKICMALAAGCSVIVRPAPESPGSVAALVQCCVDAGLPPGVVTLLFGTPEKVIAPLMAEPIVRKVSFTGSTRVGKLLIGQSAQTVKRLTMELGGHAPVLVFEDAEVEKAAEIAALAKFRNAGQVCTSPSRFYVHESIADQFVAGVASVARNLKLGNGLDPSVTMGPLATARQRDRAEALVTNARDLGAQIVCGGGRPRYLNAGYFFEPTVITDLDPRSEILTEEPFAPIAPIVTFSDPVEVLAKANGLEAGLAAYVFTRSLERASLISEQLEAGVVGVNTCAVALPEAPFGGVKQSGFGREGGATAIYDYLNVKFTHTHVA